VRRSGGTDAGERGGSGDGDASGAMGEVIDAAAIDDGDVALLCGESKTGRVARACGLSLWVVTLRPLRPFLLMLTSFMTFIS